MSTDESINFAGPFKAEGEVTHIDVDMLERVLAPEREGHPMYVVTEDEQVLRVVADEGGCLYAVPVPQKSQKGEEAMTERVVWESKPRYRVEVKGDDVESLAGQVIRTSPWEIESWHMTKSRAIARAGLLEGRHAGVRVVEVTESGGGYITYRPLNDDEIASIAEAVDGAPDTSGDSIARSVVEAIDLMVEVDHYGRRDPSPGTEHYTASRWVTSQSKDQ